MKYIVFNMPDSGETPILFPGSLRHIEMAKRIRFPVVSAGFVELNGEGCIKVTGHSHTLRVDCRKQDEFLIKQALAQSML